MKHLIRLLIQHNKSLVPANLKKKIKEIMSGKEECLPYEDWIQQELPNQCWIQQAASTSTCNWGPLPCALMGFSAQQNTAAKNFDSILIDSSKGSLILIPAAQELESAPGLPGADSRQVMVRAFEFQARSGLGTVPWPLVLVRVCCTAVETGAAVEPQTETGVASTKRSCYITC